MLYRPKRGQKGLLMARQLKKLSVKAGLHRSNRVRPEASSLQMARSVITWLISGSTFLFSTFQPTDLSF